MLFSYILNKAVPLFRNSFSPYTQKASITNQALKNLGMRDKLYKSIHLEIKSFEPAVLKSYGNFITTAAKYLNINIKNIELKKPNIQRFCVLKSIFGHKKHMVQYEIRTHYHSFYVKNLTGSTAETFLEYIERMLPEGVGLKVTRVCLEPLPSHLNLQNSEKMLQQ